MRPVAAGFSLVEVVVAVGVFGAGAVAAIALLSQTTSSASERLEKAAAERVAESSKALLTTASWDEIVGRMTTGTTWHADRSGTRIDLVDTLETGERFFALQLVRDESLFPIGTETAAAQAVGWVEVRWPVQDASGNLISAANQDSQQTRLVLMR